VKLTVFYDGQFWVGVVEEIVNGKLRAGRYLFGSEPKDQEVFAFVNTKLLDFMNGLSEQQSVENRQPKKMNPKRLARQVAREMKANGVSTFAQAALQLEYEKRKTNPSQSYLHTLGNLTLTRYNSELSDRPFKEKRDMEGGFADSPLRLNKELAKLEAWNEEAILKRAQFLADLALKVWGYPQLSDEILAY